MKGLMWRSGAYISGRVWCIHILCRKNYTICSAQKQLHRMHNSKPVSGVTPLTAGQGCLSQNGYPRWLWQRGSLVSYCLEVDPGISANGSDACVYLIGLMPGRQLIIRYKDFAFVPFVAWYIKEMTLQHLHHPSELWGHHLSPLCPRFIPFFPNESGCSILSMNFLSQWPSCSYSC